ncbi:GreA/GreB family elongation factor [Spiroplasma poulsonii]|uniref:hypothetical protein n=1 Tax=Spiroplasma poulsonii TaxID=2138 RepID=UPI001F4C6A71|nr:hypothetical protein [Spiroplasma poulsonii]UNF61971.1 hypothetical protein MNU24_00455 [Spiroplasma poulsonii]
MNEEILLTKEGIKDLQEELDNLINVIRPEVIEELKEARAIYQKTDYGITKSSAEVIVIKEIELLNKKAKEIKENQNGIHKLK